MSNNRGNIKLAFQTFLKDLQTCSDYQKFKDNATVVVYEDRLTFGMSAISDIVDYDLKPINDSTNLVEVDELFKPAPEFKTTVIKQVPITIYYRVPEVNTKETRRLNKKLKI